MIAKLLKSGIGRYLHKGNERSRQIKNNILTSFLLKVGNIVIGLLLIPLTINYVNQTTYGVWLTLSSIIYWFYFFDVGFGNGLRNKITEEKALGKPENARIYISTTYAILLLISVFIFLVFFIVNHFINWNVILNISPHILSNLNSIALIVFGFFCVQLVLQLLNVVMFALQNPAKISLLNFIGQFISLVIIYLLTKITVGKLEYLVFALGGIPLIVLFIGSIYFYKNTYKAFSPQISFVDFSYARDLFRTGSIFFVIQIGALVLYETDNIVIVQVFGPKQVTIFNIAYKLFSIVTMISTIIMTPFWSAFTDAYARDDFDWIKVTNSKLYSYFVFACIMSLILLLASPFIINIWLGSKIHVPFLLSALMSLQIMGYCWLMINCFFLNGIGKIKLQFYLYLLCMVINVPLSIILSKKIGIAGVTLANLIVYAYMNIVLYIQAKKIMKKTATGIWNR